MSNLIVADATGTPRTLAATSDAAGVLTPRHSEDPAQRDVLLAALASLAAGQVASAAELEAIRGLLAGSLRVLFGAVALVDRRGAIATAGVSQLFVAANPARRYLRLVNPSSAAESLWLNDTGAAASATDGSSLELIPGAVFEWPAHGLPASAVNVVAATAGHPYSGKEG